MKIKIAAGVAVVLALVLLSLAFRSPSPEALCKEAFEKKFGERISSFEITEKTWNSISYDLSGLFNGGEWSCALGNNPTVFNSGILFPRDSAAVVFSKEDID